MDNNAFGKVLFVGIVALCIWGIAALIQSKSETARRTRLVIGAAIVLGLAALVFTAAGPVGFAIAIAVCGAIYWVAEGRKK